LTKDDSKVEEEVYQDAAEILKELTQEQQDSNPTEETNEQESEQE
jgi:hypothetical protein